MSQTPRKETIQQVLDRIKARGAASCLIVTTAQELRDASPANQAKQGKKRRRYLPSAARGSTRFVR